jgi:hypothetical protein
VATEPAGAAASGAEAGSAASEVVQSTPEASEPAPVASGAAPSAASLIDVFNDGYNFNAPGRINGIRNGSLAPTGHGLQLSYRKTGLLISGNGWIDTGYRSAHNKPAADDSKFVQQGRVLMRFTPTFTYGNWFVKAQAEILGHAKFADQNPYVDTDDAWVAAGYWNLFDIQVGRYEAWEVYHKGLGLERDTLEDLGADGGQDIYEVNHAFYRESSYGQAALHVYPLDILRFEVNSILGNQSAEGAVGVRGAGILDLGYVKVKAGAERKHLTPTRSDPNDRHKTMLYGFGGSVVGILPPYLEVGVNAAYGYSDKFDQNRKLLKLGTSTTLSYGGFANFRVDKLVPALSGLMLGVGANITDLKNQSCGTDLKVYDDEGFELGKSDGTTVTPLTESRCGSNYHRQFFAAIQHDLFDHALIKIVGGLADAYRLSGNKADESDSAQKNKVWNVRLRALVWF